jgi:hypothetical protein
MRPNAAASGRERPECERLDLAAATRFGIRRDTGESAEAHGGQPVDVARRPGPGDRTGKECGVGIARGCTHRRGVFARQAGDPEIGQQRLP